jgi:hypothetical protein
MADNITAPGAGAVLATDDIGGVQYPRSKVVHGADGSATDASESAPLPVVTLHRPSGFAPGYSGAESVIPDRARIDPDGGLVTRSTALTDEGTFRCNFANTSLVVSIGSVTISGAVVTGTGLLASDVHVGDYFKLAADAETAWLQVESIDTDTQLTLVSAYVGSASGTGERALVQPVTGTGGSLAVASGQLTIGGGTTIAANTKVRRLVDFAPLIYRARLSVSQRIANQTIYVGLEEPASTSRFFARFAIDGTTNTVVRCETGRNPTGAPSASETESNTITLPNGGTSAALRDYRVELLTEVVRFFVDGVLVASHARVVPQQHDEMAAVVEVLNGGTAPASNTNVVVDYVTAKNHNKLEVGIFSEADQIVAVQPTMQPFAFTQAGVIAINTDLLVIDCAQLRALSIHTVSLGTTGVITAAWSNDGVNFFTATMLNEAGAVGTATNGTLRWCNVIARYFRLRLTTATTAGTTTLAVFGSQFANPPIVATQPVSGTVSVGTVSLNALPTGANTIGQVRLAPDAGQGASTTHHAISAATTNATSVKATAGNINNIVVSNASVTAKYFKLYNLAAAPTVGTSTPIATVLVPAGQTVSVDCGPFGIRCATGIAYALTGGITVADTTAVALNDLSVAMTYT